MGSLVYFMRGDGKSGKGPEANEDGAMLWKRKGNDLFHQGKYESALSCYNKGLENDPDNCELWNNKGFCLFKLGKAEEAQKCKEKIHDLKNVVHIESAVLPIQEVAPIIQDVVPIPPVTAPIPPQTREEPSVQIQTGSGDSVPKTAYIYGISGSTKHLLRGMRPIHGKKFTTFEEIDHFYHNYDGILADTELNAKRQQDELISALQADESRLAGQQEEAIARNRMEVDITISELKNKSNTSRNFIPKILYQFQYWTAIALKSPRIYLPVRPITRELGDVQSRKKNLIMKKSTIIENEYRNVVDSQRFIEGNKTFYIGAHGEELVIAMLSGLSEEYHILNDINLHFQPAIFWKEKKDPIKTSQIDHIVVGPTGVFFIETKNWKPSDIGVKSDELAFQVRRSNYALWRYLVDYYQKDEMPKIRNIVVSIYGSDGIQKIDPYIDVISPEQLPGYITRRERTISPNAIEKLVSIIPYN